MTRILAAVLLAALTYGGYQHFRASNLARDKAALQLSLRVEQGKNMGLKFMTAWLERGQDRRDQQRVTQRRFEDDIRTIPDTQQCADSPAIRAALDELRERERAREAVTSDTEPFRVRPEAEGPDQ